MDDEGFTLSSEESIKFWKIESANNYKKQFSEPKFNCTSVFLSSIHRGAGHRVGTYVYVVDGNVFYLLSKGYFNPVR